MGLLDVFSGIPIVGNLGTGMGLWGKPPGAGLPEAAAKATEGARGEAATLDEYAKNLIAAYGMPGASAPIIAPNIQAPYIPPPQAPDVNKYMDYTVINPNVYRSYGKGYDVTKTPDALSYASGLKTYDPTMAKYVGPAETSILDTTINTPTIGPATLIRSTTVGPGGTIGGTATQGREELLAAARRIGEGPLASDLQFRAGLSQVASDQLAMANMARGSQRAGARREAMLHFGQQGIGAALAAAAAAAQEEQARRTGVTNALMSVRGQDITLEARNAELANERAVLQAQLDQARAIGDADAANQIARRQAELELEAKKSGVSFGIQQQSTLADLAKFNAVEKRLFEMRNADEKTKATSNYANEWNKALAEWTALQNKIAAGNAASATEASKYKTEIQNAADATYATNQNLAEQWRLTQERARRAANATTALSLDQTYDKQLSDYYAALARNASDVSGKNATNYLDTQRNNILASQDWSRLGLTAQQIGLQGLGSAGQLYGDSARTEMDAARAAAESKQKQQTALISAASGIGGALISGKLGGGGSSGGGDSESTAAHEGAHSWSQPSNTWSQPSNYYGNNGYYGSGGSQPGNYYGGSTPSDKEVKEAIRDVSTKDLMELAAAMDAKLFRYKKGVEDSGQNVHGGIIAQDIENTKLGQRLVHKDEDGQRTVDYLSLAGLMAAAAANAIRGSKRRG